MDLKVKLCVKMKQNHFLEFSVYLFDSRARGCSPEVVERSGTMSASEGRNTRPAKRGSAPNQKSIHVFLDSHENFLTKPLSFLFPRIHAWHSLIKLARNLLDT